MPSEPGQRSGHAAMPLPRILVFHKSQPRFSWGATNFSPLRLRKLLYFIAGKGYQFAALQDVLDAPDDRAVATTFDDGYRHLREVLPPLIDEFGLRPTVFVPTDLMGQENSWDYSHRLNRCPHLSADDIAFLADLGVDFGSHGASHTALTQLPVETMQAELAESRQRLGQLTGNRITSISYPFGRTNPEIVDACRNAGYSQAFTMSYPTMTDTSFTMGRMAVYGYDTPLTVLRKLSISGPGFRLERRKAVVTNRLAGGSILLNSLRSRRPRPVSR